MDNQSGSAPGGAPAPPFVDEAPRQPPGRRFWRSLEELADTPEFRRRVEREFPRYAPGEWSDGPSRRSFLQLAGASMALAGLTACTRQPAERLVPYVDQPENLVPGKPLFFATSMSLAGYATGLLAESHMGRPTKLDGNPEHPASLGATDVYAQAAVLELYDPDRSRSIENLGKILPWQSFAQAMQPVLRAQEALSGAGMRILTRTVSSPSFAAQMRALQTRFPELRWHQYEAAGRDAVQVAGRRAFGEWVETRYDLSLARVILSLDSDFLVSGPGSLRYAHDFAARRRVYDGATTMNRLYSVESTPTATGSIADHRLAAAPAEVAELALALASALGVPGAGRRELDQPKLSSWLDPLIDDLRSHPAESLVVAGEHLPPELHVLVHGINERLGNLGKTVVLSDPVTVAPVEQAASLQELVRAMNAGEVDALFILDANPVYESPSDVDFVAGLERVALRVHLGRYRDETASYCHWHLPQSHFLESWGDGRAYDGTLTLVQPLIEPLYDGKSDLELLALLAGRERSDYDLVRAQWQELLAEEDFDGSWRQALHDGFLAGSALPAKEMPVRAEALGEASRALSAGRRRGGLELLLRPDPTLFDGRFANNGWLQELPKPLTLLTWDNAALISPATAERLGLRSEEVVRLRIEDRELEAPVLVLPGQADGIVTLHLGHGRLAGGRVAKNTGADAYRLRSLSSPWQAGEVELEKTGRRHRLATTQSHHNIDTQTEEATERHLVRHGTLAEFLADPDFVEHLGHHKDPSHTMFPGWKYEGYSWAMGIDLSVCTGCSACVIACQAENNVPVVGKEAVLNGREMHWLRIDRYYEGDLNQPSVHHQPLTCMHCEQAPCEIVCPVAATVHGPEGLNEMIYNRCVGTRYCSNNCPYKVRRFNFFKYNDTTTPVLKLGRNPDVTVRSRGVMEKCSYCVQRINTARIEAKKERRRIRDGEVKTACQEVCPTRAIAFGDLNDPDAQIHRFKKSPLDYSLLDDELNTQPRTTYLAKISNPNPKLGGSTTARGDHESH